MKALFILYPHYGHIIAHLQLMKELRELGDEIICLGDESYRSLIESSGFTFYPYLELEMHLGLQSGFPKFRDMEVSPIDYVTQKCMAYEKLIKNTYELAQIYSKELESYHFDYILYDCGVYMGSVIGELLDIPAICCNTEMVEFPQLIEHDFMFFLKYVLEVDIREVTEKDIDDMRKIVKLFMRKYKNKYQKNIGFENSKFLNIVYISKSMQPYDQYLDDKYCYIGYELHKSDNIKLQIKQEKDKKLITITQGSEHYIRERTIDKIINIFGDSNDRVVVILGFKNKHLLSKLEKRRVPPNITFVEVINQVELLKQSDLFITHGGLNGIREALLCGVPLVFTRDRKYSYQIKKLGAGEIIDLEKDSIEDIKCIVEKCLIDKKYKTSAKQIGTQLRESGGHKKAALIIRDILKRR